MLAVAALILLSTCNSKPATKYSKEISRISGELMYVEKELIPDVRRPGTSKLPLTPTAKVRYRYSVLLDSGETLEQYAVTDCCIPPNYLGPVTLNLKQNTRTKEWVLFSILEHNRDDA